MDVQSILSFGAIVFGGVWVFKALTTVLGRPEQIERPANLPDYSSPYITGDAATFEPYWELLTTSKEDGNRVLAGKTIEVRYLQDGFTLLRFGDFMNKWFMVGPDLVERIKKASNEFNFNITYY